jgi:predicted metalloprotease
MLFPAHLSGEHPPVRFWKATHPSLYPIARPKSGMMEADEIRKQLAFLAAETDLAARFGIPTDAFLPLFFSLRFGGDWSYRTESIATLSVMKKTSVYDEETGLGYSREEIYLLVNPTLLHREGKVFRLEKCGEEPNRLLVQRPYRVTVSAERVIRMTVHPLEKEIRTEELDAKEMTFSGSTAYDIDHEMEHLAEERITGEGLWEFRFV